MATSRHPCSAPECVDIHSFLCLGENRSEVEAKDEETDVHSCMDYLDSSHDCGGHACSRWQNETCPLLRSILVCDRRIRLMSWMIMCSYGSIPMPPKSSSMPLIRRKHSKVGVLLGSSRRIVFVEEDDGMTSRRPDEGWSFNMLSSSRKPETSCISCA